MTGWAAAAGLLVVITAGLSCPAVGQTPFTVSVSQDVYQAEEHGNITLTWLVSDTADMSSDSLVIDVVYVEPWKRIFLFERTQIALYPDEFYRGRVWCDPDLAGKRQIECVITNVTLRDTGMYQCSVIIDRYSTYKTCDLNVTAVIHWSLQEDSEPAGRGRISLLVFVFLMLVIAVSTIVYMTMRRRN